MVRVSDIGLAPSEGGRARLSGRIDDIELWFEFPADADPQLRAEPFLACAIFRAMWAGETLSFDASAPLSPTILENFWKFQAIFRQWHPELHRVQISAATLAEPEPSGIVASSFSGGVDSNFTLHMRDDDLTHLLLSDSFDDMRNDEPFEALRAKIAATAERCGKQLITVRSNVRSVRTQFMVSWEYLHGPILASMASVLGTERFYIPSSDSFRTWEPWGSHAVLDPLWSWPAGRVVHDGLYFFRTEKTEALAGDPAIVRSLQVCWRSKLDNCGACVKCVRTMLVLTLLGVDQAPFPNYGGELDMKALKPTSAIGASHVWDLMKFAERRGETSVSAQLRGLLRAYQRRRSALDLLLATIPQSWLDARRARGDEPWRKLLLTRQLSLRD